MRPCGGRRDPPARGTGQQSLPYEEGLGDLLDGLPLLPHRDGQRGEPDRAAAEQLEQGVEDTAVEAVETAGVDLVDLQGGRGDVARDRRRRP